MDPNYLLQILKEEQYPAYMLEKTMEKLNNLNPEISLALENWALQGQIPAIDIMGYTFQSLTQEMGMTPIGAFLALNWLLKDPENAKSALSKGIR